MSAISSTALYIPRRARVSDLEEISAIEHASFPVPWRREFFASELSDERHYHRVLERALPGTPRLAGYFFGVFLFDEFHVNKIATHPAVRGEGHGRRLMEDALREAKRRSHPSCSTVILEVRVSNNAAIEFYRAFGFREAGRRRHYYQDGEDALVLVLPLLDLAPASG